MGGHTLDTINISKIYNLRQQKASIKYAAKIPHITSALLMHKCKENSDDPDHETTPT